MSDLPLLRTCLPLAVYFSCLSIDVAAQEQLRSLADVQVDASLAAADRAISEAESEETDDPRIARTLHSRRDELLANSSRLRATRLNPLDNRLTDDAFIVNGTTTFLFGAAGALLVGADPTEARVRCSGTVIGCETFLTARHCVENTSDSSLHVFLQSEGILGVEALPAHSDYNWPFADLQLLRLSRPVSAVKPATINTDPLPMEGSPGRIVGFGHTSLLANDHGIKRVGSLTTEQCESGDEGFICWHYDTTQATTCHVDSGGPLFVSIPDSEPVLAGVTAGVDSNCSTVVEYSDVDVQFFADWLQETGGADVGQQSCTAAAGDLTEAIQYQAIEGTLSQNQEAEYSMPVSSDVLEIRISLNAEDRRNNNLDLAATVTAADSGDEEFCSSAGGSNFEYCRFQLDSPARSVSIKVSQEGSDDGRYQLLVTNLHDAG